MKTVAQLKADIRADMWPSLEPENLITAHDNHFQEAFADICKWVDCEQQNNANLVKFCKTNYKSGMTVLSAPTGRIFRVFTVANDDFSDPVFYRQVIWPEPENWARNLYLFPRPLVTDARKLPLGFDYANAANDSLYGRARTGIWAIWKGNIYMAPWIQSNEQVVIEWDGIKDKWDDGDPINSSVLYRKAVKFYAQFAHERDYGDASRATQFSNPQYSGHYDIALGDMIHECRLQTKVRIDFSSTALERDRLCAELADDAIITDADGVVIADLGNFTTPGADMDALGAQVFSWGVDAITACNLGPDYDATIGAKFHGFMLPYLGSQGAAGSRMAVWPAPSAADWALDALSSLDNFFTVQNNGRYYTVVIGDIQLFIVNSNAAEPDGIDAGSVQAQWLQAGLAISTAPWKIVKMDDAPYSSIGGGNPTLQWPFRSWGADMVISSSKVMYERMLVGDLPVINNGLGSKTPIQVPTQAINFSKVLYSAGAGVGRISASTENLLYQFYDKAGNLVDSVTVSKS